MDSDLITKALAKFYNTKEEKLAHEMSLGQGRRKKRSNFESEKETEERKRKTQKL